MSKKKGKPVVVVKEPKPKEILEGETWARLWIHDVELRKKVWSVLKKYEATRHMLPLEIGAHGKMIADGLDPQLVAVALRRYVGSNTYLKRCLQFGKRYHLDGSEASDLTEKEIAYCEETLAQRERKKEEARKKAET